MSAGPNHVVVGYDFSHSGHPALDRAIALASTPHHVLHVVCVIDPRHEIPGIPASGGIDEAYAVEVQRALAVVVERTRAALAATGSTLVHAPISGSPAQAIVDLATEVGAELIVVGSHDLSGLERLLAGSVSAKIERIAPCPVEIARAAATDPAC